MKSLTTRVLLIWTVLLSCIACTNNNDPESTTTTSTSSDTLTTTTSNTAPAGSTISTTPRNMVVIRHKVKDFDTWKAAYDSHDSARLANGLHNYVVSRGTQDPNMVQVALRADDLEKAQAFLKDPDLKTRMQKGGVVGTPDMEIVTLVFQDTVKLSTNLRSLTRFDVKDWATWEKNFKDGEQERINNGITVRGYGHEAGNNKKVRIVTAILDTAKAYAYWKSDMLKKRREAGGVISEVDRFVHQVVQRY